MEKQRYMQAAIDLSIESVKRGGGPFGAVIVKDGEIVAAASNSVTLSCDPTAHAEVNAIREACQALKSFSLEGCELYSSCEPCPMCLSAAYWAGVKCIYYGNSRSDAQSIDFSDSFIYDQIPLSASERTIPSVQMMSDSAIKAFDLWREKEDKIVY